MKVERRKNDKMEDTHWYLNRMSLLRELFSLCLAEIKGNSSLRNATTWEKCYCTKTHWAIRLLEVNIAIVDYTSRSANLPHDITDFHVLNAIYSISFSS